MQNVWNVTWCIHFPPHPICVATLLCRSPKFAVNNDYIVSIMEVLRQPRPITRSSDPVKSAGRPSCPVFALKFSVKTSRSVTFQFLVIKIVSLKEDSILITKYWKITLLLVFTENLRSKTGQEEVTSRHYRKHKFMLSHTKKRLQLLGPQTPLLHAP